MWLCAIKILASNENGFICQGFLVEFSYSLCNNTYYEKNAFVQISIKNSFYADMKSSKKICKY